MKKLSKSDEKMLKAVGYLFDIWADDYRFRPAKNINKQLHYTVKSEGKNKGEYGYFINTYLKPLYAELKKHKSDKILDLGAGSGHLIAALRALGFENIYGVENEKILIDKAVTGGIFHKDIFNLTSDFIADFDTLYFWEPFSNRILAEKFVKHLMTVTHKNQKIIYRANGFIYYFLNKMVKKGILYQYKKDTFSGLYVFKKK